MNKTKDNLLMEEIKRLKQEKKVYIIAHYYQRAAIQDIADFLGDSYAMAVAAKKSPYESILVAGVDFMAESAAILCPNKTILSPEPRATCPMANSISIDDVLDYKRKNPDGIIVSYVNTPASIKAVSDICCTSSNALTILQKLPRDARIFFIPDQNLACNVGSQLDREIDTFDSRCPTHAVVTHEDIDKLKKQYAEAEVLVHPECSKEVVEIADFVGSTGGIVKYIAASNSKKFIIGTECGIIHAINQTSPDKELIMASDRLICPNMKSITLEKILFSLENFTTKISVPEDIRQKAAMALEKMIDYSS